MDDGVGRLVRAFIFLRFVVETGFVETRSHSRSSHSSHSSRSVLYWSCVLIAKRQFHPWKESKLHASGCETSKRATLKVSP